MLGDSDCFSKQRTAIVADMPPVIGHRGAALHAPENTLAGLLAAQSLGARWVEVDVKLSGDGVPFLMHDDTLDRTTNASGPVLGRPMREIAELDAGSWFGEAFAGEPVPTLQAVLDFIISANMSINIELKPNPGEEVATARIVCDTVKRMWPAERLPPLISSYRHRALATALDAAPDIPRGLLVHKPGPNTLAHTSTLQCASIHVEAGRCSKSWLGAMERLRIPVVCYTVNDGNRAKDLLAAGAHSIISDVPERIIATLVAPRVQ